MARGFSRQFDTDVAGKNDHVGDAGARVRGDGL